MNFVIHLHRFVLVDKNQHWIQHILLKNTTKEIYARHLPGSKFDCAPVKKVIRSIIKCGMTLLIHSLPLNNRSSLGMDK